MTNSHRIKALPTTQDQSTSYDTHRVKAHPTTHTGVLTGKLDNQKPIQGTGHLQLSKAGKLQQIYC